MNYKHLAKMLIGIVVAFPNAILNLGGFY